LAIQLKQLTDEANHWVK